MEKRTKMEAAMLNVSPEQVAEFKKLSREVARDDLFAYMRLIHDIVEPGAEFIDAKHLRAIAHHLQLVERGEIKRLAIAVAPRHFKSFAASVAFSTWLLGRNPNAKIICGSYGKELSHDFAKQARRVMRSDAFKAIFSGTRLDSNGQALKELITTENGRRCATSVDGVGTGKGADTIIIDDPMKASDAHSEPAKKKAYEWIKETLMSRFNNPAEGRMIVVMQRLAIDDPIGRLMEEDNWTVLALPAKAWEDQEIQISDTETWDLQAGDLLFPERFDEEKLQEWRQDLGETAYNAQVLQRPAQPGGALFKLESFERYAETPPPEHFEKIIQSWDTALTDAEDSSFNVCTTWGVRGKQLYLLNVFRARLGYIELEKKVRELKEKWNANIVVVEKAASGHVLYSSLSKEQLPYKRWLYCMSPKQSKFERALYQLPVVERGRVYIPTAAPWLDTFLKEILEFPTAKFDDQVDSFIQFLMLFVYGRIHGALHDLSMYKGWEPGKPVL